jgi:protein-tyrosine-phosphatase
MKEIDLDVSEHRSKLVTPEMIDRSDLILVMTRRQKKALITAYPNAKSKAHRIREFDPNAPHDDITDIFHLRPGDAQKIRDSLRSCIPGIKEYVSRS